MALSRTRPKKQSVEEVVAMEVAKAGRRLGAVVVRPRGRGLVLELWGVSFARVVKSAQLELRGADGTWEKAPPSLWLSGAGLSRALKAAHQRVYKQRAETLTQERVSGIQRAAEDKNLQKHGKRNQPISRGAL